MQPPKCSYLHFSEKSLPSPHMDKRSCSRYLCFIASFLPVSRNLAPPRSSHCARGVSFWRFNVIMLEDITEVAMPKVGSKHYAYTPKGMAKAKAAAKKSGKKVSYAKKKK